jgi:FKBP-type peptidyl-prolyl cis-trans isomerase
MTKKVLTVAAIACGVTVTVALAQEPKPAAKPAVSGELKPGRQQDSYGLGIALGRQLKGQMFDPDLEPFLQGLKDGLSGTKSQLTDEQVQKAVVACQQAAIAKMREAVKAEAERNKQAGAEFLAANGKKEGVRALASGLQYKVLKDGNGPTPKETDTVKTNYRGTLIDGTEFDSSERQGGPASFAVNQVIPGWTEALQLMKVGSKWQLFIPSELAYGPQPPQGSPIPPNATLVFEIELLGIEPPQK